MHTVESNVLELLGGSEGMGALSKETFNKDWEMGGTEQRNNDTTRGRDGMGRPSGSAADQVCTEY
jgi:hypothetical protein